MEIQKIEFPKHLLEHNLSLQEQANIPADKLALAKDWNILKRQNEWMMDQLVLNRNILANHEMQLDFWSRVRWFFGVALLTVCGIALTVVTILKQVGYFK